jgi:transcriptional antiterminator NusG
MNDVTEPKKEVKVEPVHPSAPPVVVEEKPRVAPANAKWYVVHTYSGHENKVSANLRQRIETMKLADKIFDIVVPTRNIVTVKHGKKEEQKEKIFPGYILVKMVLDDASWLAVRTTQGVTAFVGAGNKPTPISEPEVATILKFMQMEAPKYKTTFSMGEAVKIVDGPFADFLGTIDAIDEEKGKIKVLVSIFGRETPVELDFLQVSKL